MWSGYEQSCPHCGGYVTRRFWIFSLWNCARCEWKGHSPSWNWKVIYLDPTKTYECPNCGNYVHPRLEMTAYVVDDNKAMKEQCCPKCHKLLPHDLRPIPQILPTEARSRQFRSRV